jgi:hypothetical protein
MGSIRQFDEPQSRRRAGDVRRIMDEGKVLLVNLSKGRLGEDSSSLLGGLLVTTIGLAAFSRADVPSEKRRDFFVYVDEFQSFTLALVNMFRASEVPRRLHRRAPISPPTRTGNSACSSRKCRYADFISRRRGGRAIHCPGIPRTIRQTRLSPTSELPHLRQAYDRRHADPAIQRHDSRANRAITRVTSHRASSEHLRLILTGRGSKKAAQL